MQPVNVVPSQIRRGKRRPATSITRVFSRTSRYFPLSYKIDPVKIDPMVLVETEYSKSKQVKTCGVLDLT